MDSLEIVAGITKLDDTKKIVYKSDYFKIHDLYLKTKTGGTMNDIGLIHLTKPIDFKNDRVKPVKLIPDQNKTCDCSSGTGVVTGWGRTKVCIINNNHSFYSNLIIFMNM